MFGSFNALNANLQTIQNRSGQDYPVEQLANLNKALRSNASLSMAKAGVGYPTQGQPAVGDLAPLVPQSIQGTLDSRTFRRKHVVLWQSLFKQKVTSTLHESNVVNEHGDMDLDPFIVEGGVGAVSEAEYERKIVQVKYLAERIVLSDPATMVGITGVNKSALAQRTLNGTNALLGKLEKSLFTADSSLSPLHFDGLHKQVRDGAPDNYTDMRDQPISPQKLMEVLGELVAEPNYGDPNAILMLPQLAQQLNNIAVSGGRHDQLQRAKENTPYIFGVPGGSGKIALSGPYGAVPITACPLMRENQKPNTNAVGEFAPSLTVGMITASVESIAGDWKNSDAGDYFVTVVAVGDKGISARVDIASALSITGEGDGIRLDIADSSAPTEGNNSIRYYRFFISPKDATDHTGVLRAGVFARNTSGGGGGTRIEYTRDKIPGTSRIYVGEMSREVLYWVQLLDFVRRPLAQVQTEVPFLLMLFGALHVKIPTKWWILDNVSLTL